MLLRSSSTPILGSFISHPSALFSENPNKGAQLHHHSLDRAASSCTSIHHAISCSYPPLPESSDKGSSASLRRARSEGNIMDLISTCSDDSQLHKSSQPPFTRHRDSVLETVPSFSVYNSMRVEEDEEEMQQEQDDYRISDPFSFLGQGEMVPVNQSSNERFQRASQPLFLARGLGIDRLPSGLMNFGGDDEIAAAAAGGNGGSDGNCLVKTDNGGEGYELELFYKRAIEEEPGNAMILRNYAQFLHQCKKNLAQAEEYYSRAIIADPTDAEASSQYGKLIWEIHGDFERASAYIQRAADIAPDDCYIQAAYASFLWETGEEAGEYDRSQEELCALPVSLAA